MDDFLGDILRQIDTLGNSFSTNAFTAMSNQVLPLFRVLFVLYVAYYGVQLIMGTAKISVSDIVVRIIRALFIVVLISSWGNFASLIYEWISNVPEAAGRALLAVSNTGITEPTTGLSQIWKVANEGATAYSEQSGYFTVLPALIGFLVLFGTGLFIALAMGILILAKVMLWVLVATAPIFISTYLFETTRKYAEGWFSQLLQYALIPLFVFTVAAFLIAALSDSMADISNNSSDLTLQISDFAAFLILCFAGFFVLLNIQAVAGGIAGSLATGVTNSFNNRIGRTARSATFAPVAARRLVADGVSRAVDYGRYRSGELGTNTGRQVMRTAQQRQAERAFRDQQTRI